MTNSRQRSLSDKDPTTSDDTTQNKTTKKPRSHSALFTTRNENITMDAHSLNKSIPMNDPTPQSTVPYSYCGK